MKSIFDYNRNGKLGPLERAIRRNARERWAKQMQSSNPPSESSIPVHRPAPKPVNPYAWRENCEDNCFGIDPDDYETEAEYEEALGIAEYMQSEWIFALTPREKELARHFAVDPEEYAEYTDFRAELDAHIDRYVEEDMRKRYPRADTMEIPEDAPYQWNRNAEEFTERMDDMKISAEKKKIFLQDTFELLKDNFVSNDRALEDIIGKMAKLDFPCAVEMWKTLIQKNPDELHNTDYFGFHIMYTVEKAVGTEVMYTTILDDPFMKNALFSELGDFDLGPTKIIRTVLFENNFALADELLALTYHNKFRKTTFYKVLDQVIRFDEKKDISEETFEIITKWIGKVSNREEKAKLNLVLLNYMEEE